MRCESPSTFLGTCLSHHSFIIFLVTNTNTLLSGLYLISTKIEYNGNVFVANLCQFPILPGTGTRCTSTSALLTGLYLISTKMYLNARSISFSVSMPSRAYTSFLRYPFKNLGFMRFPEPVFAGIYQNILTTAVFRAC